MQFEKKREKKVKERAKVRAEKYASTPWTQHKK